MPLTGTMLAGLTAALLAAATLFAPAADARPRIAGAPIAAATEHDLCRVDGGARPAPGPPTWWPSAPPCVVPRDAVTARRDATRIVIGTALALAAAVGLAVRMRRSRAQTRVEAPDVEPWAGA